MFAYETDDLLSISILSKWELIWEKEAKCGENADQLQCIIYLLLSVFVGTNLPVLQLCCSFPKQFSFWALLRARFLISDVYTFFPKSICHHRVFWSSAMCVCLENRLFWYLSPKNDTVTCVSPGWFSSCQTLKGIWGKCAGIWKVIKLFCVHRSFCV